ncbi:MAG: right-handed parallel beta-helix repeat-containing protein [Lachnospiraceae bacterium]|nr:right-handed parallel beta-helix repeat-containing protein [Lachnospiraceae bacterium]
MVIYVDGIKGSQCEASGLKCDGSKERPFKLINDAARIASPGDEVLVAPGVYREYVDPKNAGKEDRRIVYKSVEPLGAVITGAEELKGWKRYDGNVWTTEVSNEIFGEYNPYTTFVYGDWYFAGKSKHTGAIYLNNKMLYEAGSIEECIEAPVSPVSWEPEASKLRWYADVKENKTVFYVNFGTSDPNAENIEFNVRRECFMPSVTGIGYITVSGFVVTKAATTWAPPAAFQDCMIGPHWSKGWIIEDCEISNSKCSGIGLGKYLDPDNEHYFTYKHVKSPTQMERDAVCKGQYHGWLKENIGSHIIRRNNIHNCEQGGIIGRMGCVFSLIEDNHIHHINNMMELGGAEISGIKLHAAIDVIMRRNIIHDCTMGIWTDWEAQGTRITQNILWNNMRPDYARQLEGGMMCQDIFVEVGHGPTLIDNNILMSDVSLRVATQGVAMVHNLICGSFTSVGEGTDNIVDGILRQRYTPYHIPHRTEVMGFNTILHGDNRFYNNIFFQKWPSEGYKVLSDSDANESWEDNRVVGTEVWNGYPTYEEWISMFDMDSDVPNMRKLASGHWSHLPIWSEGNAYLGGAKPWEHEKNGFVSDAEGIKAEIVWEDGKPVLKTNIYDFIKDFKCGSIDSDTLGKAFEPEQRFEDTDGSTIVFDTDCNGVKRGNTVIPGPLA